MINLNDTPAAIPSLNRGDIVIVDGHSYITGRMAGHEGHVYFVREERVPNGIVMYLRSKGNSRYAMLPDKQWEILLTRGTYTHDADHMYDITPETIDTLVDSDLVMVDGKLYEVDCSSFPSSVGIYFTLSTSHSSHLRLTDGSDRAVAPRDVWKKAVATKAYTHDCDTGAFAPLVKDIL